MDDTEEILYGLGQRKMLLAEKSMLAETMQEDLDQVPEEKGDLVERKEILDGLGLKEMWPAEKNM